VQGARERASAQQLGSVGLLGKEIRQRGGDLLENLAVLLVGERGRNANVGDEQLAVVAAARAVVWNVIEAAD
jgi:hypothetical protein